MAQEPHGVQERGNQTILDRIKMAAPKVKDQRPLDPSRVMEMDDRDPRTEATQWPCFGHHTASKPCSNAHGQWTQCAICNLRLRYVPKVGSNSQSTKVENRFMVLRMLTELQPLMRGAKPTAAICLAMQKKIDAEEALNHAIDKELMNQNVMGYVVGGRPKAKASPTRTTPMVEPVPTTPRSSATQWDVIPAESPQRLANDLFEHLTMEGEGPVGEAHDRATSSGQSGRSCLSSGLGTGGSEPSLRKRDGMNFNLKNVEVKHFKVVANEHFKTAETYVTKELYNKVQPLSSNVGCQGDGLCLNYDCSGICNYDGLHYGWS